MLQMLQEEANIKNGEWQNVLDYFQSDLVKDIPFIHIWCSIYASMIFYDSKPRPSKGDLLDVAQLASVMPYCSIITTDRSMKENLVNRLRFNTKYGVEIYTPTIEGVNAFIDKLSDSTSSARGTLSR